MNSRPRGRSDRRRRSTADRRSFPWSLRRCSPRTGTRCRRTPALQGPGPPRRHARRAPAPRRRSAGARPWRAPRQITGSGDRCQRHLRGAVDVVQNRPEPPECGGDQRGTKRRAARRDVPQRGGVVPGRVSSPRRNAAEHHGHDHEPFGPVLGQRRQTLGVEAALRHDRRRHAETQAQIRQPPSMEERGGDDDGVAGRIGTVDSSAVSPSARRPTPLRSLGPTGGAGRENDGAAHMPRRRERSQRTLPPELAQSDWSTRRGNPRGHDAEVLVIVEEHVDALVLHHIRELRTGEPGVEIHDVGADLGGRNEADDEAAVVCGGADRPRCPRRRPRRVSPAPLRPTATTSGGRSSHRARR